MSNIPKIMIGGTLLTDKKVPSLDDRYGPYKSLREAYTILGPDYMDVLCYGLTVGIVQENGSIKEYWIEKIEGTDTITILNFKEKNKGGGSDVDPEFIDKVNKFMDDTNKSISNLETKTNDIGSRLDEAKPNTYRTLTDTASEDVTKQCTINNFYVDETGRPKDMVSVLVAFLKGNTAKNITLNINNLGPVPVYCNGVPFSFNLETNKKVLLMYNRSNSTWDFVNYAPDFDGVYWE